MSTRNLFAFLLTISSLFLMATSAAAEIAALPGWGVHPSAHSYADLVKRLDTAIMANKMAAVTRASATLGAKKVFDKTIPGNMVIGVFHPRYAVPMLEASIQAGIEAPIRFYITENADGTATLSYRTPGAVFEPYFDDGGDKLKALAAELDDLFGRIAAEATGQ